VIAVEGTLEVEVTDQGAQYKVRCVCDGKLELMGRVSRKPGLVLDSERCACDARCTNAPGPCCECQCGGENHGTGRVVPIEIDAGGVPRLVAEDATECRRRAEEYAAAMEPHRAELRAMREGRVGHYNRRPSLDEDRLAGALGRISALRTHKGRLAAIAKM
jgi:hypothetical protein